LAMKTAHRVLAPGSAGFHYAETVLQLHTPQARRSFLRVDSVHALHNDQLLHEFEDATNGMHVRDAWFYPYPGDDVDVVTKEGFKCMDKSPMRFGLYFLDGKLSTGRGPTLKVVLCKLAPGKSVCRTEEDVSAVTKCPTGYESVYVPGHASTEPALEDGAGQAALPAPAGIFNDTYILFDGSLALPTHIVSYHLEVDEGAMQDKELVRWVNEQCQAMFGFVEPTFAHYFVSLAQSSDSAASLAAKLRDQADVPHEVAQYFADDLFHRVRRTRGGPASPGAPRIPSEAAVAGSTVRNSLRLLNMPLPPPGETQLSAQFSRDAMKRIEQQMSALDAYANDLKQTLGDQDNIMSELDQELYERSSMFRAELVSYLKEYMLTLQVAEERQQMMMRCINDSYNAREFMEQQRNVMTKVALLRQWKNLEAMRTDLQKRIGSLAGLQGQSLALLTPTGEDSEVLELKRQVQQKDRVVQILKQRLRTSVGNNMTEVEQELLNM